MFLPLLPRRCGCGHELDRAGGHKGPRQAAHGDGLPSPLAAPTVSPQGEAFRQRQRVPQPDPASLVPARVGPCDARPRLSQERSGLGQEEKLTGRMAARGL